MTAMESAGRLSGRRRRLFQFIQTYHAREGRPPTYAEMQQAVGISSKSLVRHHLNVLIRLGLLERVPSIARGARPPVAAPSADEKADAQLAEAVDIARALAPGEGELYGVRAHGDAWLPSLVRDGDVVVLRPQNTAADGEFVAAWLLDRGERILGRCYRERTRFRFDPADCRHAPIYANPHQVLVEGLVIAVIRNC